MNWLDLLDDPPGSCLGLWDEMVAVVRAAEDLLNPRPMIRPNAYLVELDYAVDALKAKVESAVTLKEEG